MPGTYTYTYTYTHTYRHLNVAHLYTCKFTFTCCTIKTQIYTRMQILTSTHTNPYTCRTNYDTPLFAIRSMYLHVSKVWY